MSKYCVNCEYHENENCYFYVKTSEKEYSLITGKEVHQDPIRCVVMRYWCHGDRIGVEPCGKDAKFYKEKQIGKKEELNISEVVDLEKIERARNYFWKFW